MVDPISAQQVSSIQPTDTTSDVAGAAGVTPGYIPTDVQTVPSLDETVGIDNVSVSSSVTTTEAGASAAPEAAEESSNYIQSEAPSSAAITDIIDNYSMNTMQEVLTANNYIEPTNSDILSIIGTLTAQGVITTSMTEDEVAIALNTYVNSNYAFIPDQNGDRWYTVTQTMLNGGGDCEDLANLEASLLIAALINRGVSVEEANSRVFCLVTVSPATSIGHVVVAFTNSDNTIKYLDPSISGAFSVTDTLGEYRVPLFSYSSLGVDVKNAAFDYSTLSTGAAFVLTDATSVPLPLIDYTKYAVEQANLITATINVTNSLTTLINAVAAQYGFNGTEAQWNALLGIPGGSTFIMVSKTGFEAPEGGFHGINQMNVYNDLVLLRTQLAANPTLGNSLLMQTVFSEIQGLSFLVPSLSPAINTLMNNMNTYNNVRIPAFQSCIKWTNNFMEFMLYWLNRAEHSAFDLNMWISKVNMATEIVNQDSIIIADTQARDSLQHEFDTTSAKTVGCSKFYPNLPDSASSVTDYYCMIATYDGTTWMAAGTDWTSSEIQDMIDYYNNYGSYVAYNNIAYATQSAVYRYEHLQGWINNFNTAINNATATKNNLIAQYMSTFNLTPAQYAADISNTQSHLLQQNMSTGYWEVNWDADIFRPVDSIRLVDTNGNPYWMMDPTSVFYLNPFDPNIKSISWKMEVVKAESMLFSLIYEARRDLRNAAEQELTGEQGYRGMAISRLFMKKVNKMQDQLRSTIANALNAMNALNDANHTYQVSVINQAAEDEEAAIQNESGPAWWDLDGVDTRQERVLEREQTRLDAVSAEDDEAQAIDDANAAQATEHLRAIGIDTGGGSIDDMLSNLQGTINSVANQMDDITYTDDDGYQHIDRTTTTSLRNQLRGAFALRRTVLVAQEALNNMRSLVHEEMTGVGGRKSNMEAAMQDNEDQGKATLEWFDECVDSTSNSVALFNDHRQNDLQHDQNQAVIDEYHSQRDSRRTSGWLGGLATLCTIISIFVPWMIIGSIIFGMASSIISSQDDRDIANLNRDLEDQYAGTDYTAGDEAYTPQTSGVVTDDAVFGLAFSAEDDSQNVLGGMTSANYIHSLDDTVTVNGVTTGSSIIDSVAVAAAGERMSANDIKILIAQAARQAMIQARNLAHQEMTGIGGREPSNMTNYALEAARGQESFIFSQQYAQLMDINQANNIRYQRELRRHQAQIYADNANTGLNLSYIPIFGSSASRIRTNLLNLYQQRDDAERAALAQYTTSTSLNDDILNNLITGSNSTTDAGDGNVAVNFQAIIDARRSITSAFIAASTEGTIKKTLSNLRNIVHMEMTQIGGVEGGELTEAATMVNFQTAMRSLQLVTNYLQQRVQLANRRNQAEQELRNIQQKINVARDAQWTAVVLSVGSMIFGGLNGAFTSFLSSWSGFLGGIQTIQLAGTIAGAVASVGDAINAWLDLNYSRLRANAGMQDLAAYLNLHRTMQESGDPTTARLEELEQQCIDEISANLMQDLGGGHIGINRGLSARYAALLEKRYKAEKVKSDLQTMLQELRNMAHEAMTGVSGITSKGAQTTLAINEASIKATIEDMFSKLDSAAERYNQLRDAERAELRAEIAAMRTSVEAFISTAMAVMSFIQANSSQAKGVNQARTNYDNAQEALKNTPKVDPKALGDATEALSKAKTALDEATKAFNIYKAPFTEISTYLTVASLASELAFDVMEKSALKALDQSANAEVANMGIGTAAESSIVVAANQEAGGYENLVALAQEKSGQQELNAKAAGYKNQERQINGEYKQRINSLYKDLAFNKSTEILQMGINALAPEKTDMPAFLKSSDIDNFLLETVKDPQKREAIKTAMAKELAELDTNKPEAAVACLDKLSTLIKSDPAFKPDETQPARSKASLDRLSSLISKIETQIAAMTKEVTQLEQANKPELKDTLEALKAKLAKLQSELSAKKAELTALTQGKLPEAQKALAQQAEVVRLKRDLLLAEIQKMEEQMAKLLRKAQLDGDPGKLIEKQVNKLKADLAMKLAEYEVEKVKYELASANVEEVIGDIKGATEKGEELKRDINAVQGQIRETLKAIGLEANPAAEPFDEVATPSVNQFVSPRPTH